MEKMKKKNFLDFPIFTGLNQCPTLLSTISNRKISTLDLWIVLSFSAACDQIRIDVYHAGRSDPAVPRRCGEKKSQRLPGQPAAAVSTPRGPEHRSVLRRLVDVSTVFLTRSNITLVLRLAFWETFGE